MKLRGYAAVYNRPSSPELGFVETIAFGAFDDADLSDVRCLFNHGKDNVLGRSTSGTLTIAGDARGLLYDVELPDTEQAKHVFEAVKRRDVSGSSFSFRIARGGDEWEYDEETNVVRRTITKFERVTDAGPVLDPAYPDTSCRVIE